MEFSFGLRWAEIGGTDPGSASGNREFQPEWCGFNTAHPRDSFLPNPG
jgi:hypothetical protein